MSRFHLCIPRFLITIYSNQTRTYTLYHTYVIDLVLVLDCLTDHRTFSTFVGRRFQKREIKLYLLSGTEKKSPHFVHFQLKKLMCLCEWCVEANVLVKRLEHSTMLVEDLLTSQKSWLYYEIFRNLSLQLFSTQLSYIV